MLQKADIRVFESYKDAWTPRCHRVLHDKAGSTGMDARAEVVTRAEIHTRADMHTNKQNVHTRAVTAATS